MQIEKKLLEIPFDCIKDLIVEPCLSFTPEGLSINAFAESNAAMIIFHLPKEKFIEYNFVNDQKFKISSDIFSKIMKRIKTKNVNLEFKDAHFIISDEKKKEYRILVMEDNDVKRDMPQLTLNSSVQMNSEELKDLFLDAEVIGDNIKIEIKNSLILSSGHLNKFNQEVECDTIGEGISHYSLEYLNKFMNVSKYFKDVLFEFSSDSPCKLTFKDELEIQFILAARSE